ncbi:MAG: T9SS type A sorting domain-containing protein [Bacteroidetes bacterium]|nr:T9SS type A sorting domain-containing protein [Bacteroidota bacterium]
MKTNQQVTVCRNDITGKTLFSLVCFIALFLFAIQVQQVRASDCSCHNVTNGGTIGGDESSCGGFDPGLITNVAYPCGGSGTLEYKWFKSTNNFASSSVIQGACNSTYNPGFIAQTTWYKRLARRHDCNNYDRVSNIIVKRVHTTPVVTILPSGCISFCQGETVALTASSGVSYLWSPGGATTSSITVTVAGRYTVTVTDANGCSGTTYKDVTVHSLPVSSISGNLIFCEGEQTVLSGPVSCASYLWNTGATTRCITVNSTGTYTLTVTNNHGCSSTSSAEVIVNPLPSADITGDRIICQGQQTILSAPESYTSYLWNTGATTRCITVETAGIYSVTVTNQNGCSMSGNAEVIVNPLPSADITGDASICEGEQTVLFAPEFCTTYLWNTGETTRSITVGTTGTYSVTVTNEFGCSNSGSFAVQVFPLPISTITGDDHFCNGASLMLSAPEFCASYLWSTGETTRCIFVMLPGTYSVTVSNENGCSSTSSKTVSTLPTPNSTISGCTVIRHGWFTVLSAPQGCGNTYLWSTGSTNRCIYVFCAGNYSVRVTNTFGCSSTSSVTVTWYSCKTTAAEPGQQDEGPTVNVDAVVYPNPFSSTATFRFMNKGENANMTVEVYNVEGAKVCELFNNVAEKDQQYQMAWNADAYPSGLYMYRIVCGEEIVTGRLLLQK